MQELPDFSDFELKEQTPLQKNFVEMAQEEAAISAFVLNFLINPPYQIQISDQTPSQTVTESEGEGEGDTVNKSEEKKLTGIGLTSPAQILRLFCRVFDLPTTMTYYPHGSNVQSLGNWQNYQKAYGSSNESFAKTLKIPPGFPSLIMSFGQFENCKTLIKRLKIPANRDKFIEDLNAAIATFYADKGKTFFTKNIVFQVKQAIARIEVMDPEVDHLNMEYSRGGVELLLTGRPRTIIDRSGAVSIPAQSNKIRGFPANSFLDDLTTNFYGLVTHLYSLCTYSIKDDFFRVSLELNLAPWQYCTDAKTKKKIETVAKLLEIKETDIDFSPSQVMEGITEMLNGAVYEASRLYEKHYAKFNLPLKVQVLVMEECIHLHNVRHLLLSNPNACFNNKYFKNGLYPALQEIIAKNITLQEFLNVIHEHEKNKSVGEYGFKASAPVIQSYLQNFIINTLEEIDGVHENIFTGHTLTDQEKSQNTLSFYQDLQQWIQNAVTTSESLEPYKESKEALDTGGMAYEEFINVVSSMLYKINQKRLLYRIGQVNLFGPLKLVPSESTLEESA